MPLDLDSLIPDTHFESLWEVDFTDHGVDNSQYFTRWGDHINSFTGVGSNPHEAAEDALGSMASSTTADDPDKLRAIDNAKNPFAEDDADHLFEAFVQDWEPTDEEAEELASLANTQGEDAANDRRCEMQEDDYGYLGQGDMGYFVTATLVRTP